MGYLTDTKTGKRLNAEDFLKREKKEWGEALGTFAKECLGAGKETTNSLFATSERELRRILRGAR